MPAPELVVIGILAALLAAASAAAGGFWWRSRSLPLVRVAQLARDLAERQRALEQLLQRWEAPRARDPAPGGLPVGPRGGHGTPNHRIDPPQATAVAGPTLIAVPDLAMNGSKGHAMEVSAELQRRYGAIWEMAERGLGPEAIARATGQPAGQIELVLNLRRGLNPT